LVPFEVVDRHAAPALGGADPRMEAPLGVPVVVRDVALLSSRLSPDPPRS
jgi:hypothetical protein